jgi:hypothetical protein
MLTWLYRTYFSMGPESINSNGRTYRPMPDTGLKPGRGYLVRGLVDFGTMQLLNISSSRKVVKFCMHT